MKAPHAAPLKARVASLLRRVPVLWHLARGLKRRLDIARFRSSAGYWEARYQAGGTSGSGSYGDLAAYKARIVNEFVAEHRVKSVIEFGCGDGNQLSLASYPRYVGLDVSPTILRRCIERFGADATKSFFRYDPFAFLDRAGCFRAELALSLDVIFHLVEDEVFERYMHHLFDAALRFVVIYSSDSEQPLRPSAHERHRSVTSWIRHQRPDWELQSHLQNPRKYDLNRTDPAADLSYSDFFIYARRDAAQGGASQPVGSP